MPPDRDRLSGKYGYIRVTDGVNNRASVPIVSWDATIETTFQDSTGSCNYNRGDQIVYRSSVPSVRSLTAAIQGYYRRSATPDYVIEQLFEGGTPFRVELGFSPLDPFADFYAWAENFQTTSAILETVRFSCSLRSEGTVGNLSF